MPVAVEGEAADAEHGGGDDDPEHRPVRVELPGDRDGDRARNGGDRVEFGSGADERGRLACDDVAQHAAADRGRDAEGGGRDRRQP